MDYQKNFNLSEFGFEPEQKNAQRDVYMISRELEQAVRVAILLKKPLLLTGDPGTGKTELAKRLAADLAGLAGKQFLDFPLVFNTKTLSAASELFYTYDALGHFRASGVSGNKDVKAEKFIQLKALGQAMFLSKGNYAPPYRPMREMEDFDYSGFSGPIGSVVLIDEVDKAPKDFCNDLLNEIENMEFTVKEDDHRHYEGEKSLIVMIMTSNSEKSLPDAFLRRCIFHHIDLPDEALLEEIVINKVFTAEDQEERGLLDLLVKDYVAEFLAICDQNLKKKPATAELISWVYYLKKYILDGIPFNQVDPAVQRASMGILLKHLEDQQSVKEDIL